MFLILSIDALVAGLLTVSAITRGFERTLPIATFLLMLFPVESQITLPGFFDLTTQRVIVITLLGLYLTTGRPDQQGASPRHLPLAFLIGLQLIWLGIATAHSVVFTISLKTVLSQILDFTVVFYIFTKSIRDVETLQKIIRSFVTAMIILSVFGAIEAYSGWSVISLFPETSHRFGIEGYGGTDRAGRVQVTFSHAILFGGTLAMAIPAALYLGSIATRRTEKLFIWGGISLMFLDIYKTGSRGPWIALALSLAAFAVMGHAQLRKYIIIIAMLTVSVLIVRPGVWATLHDMYYSTRDPDSPMGESYQWRYTLYDLAQKELSRDTGRAVWGYGPESFYYLNLTTDFKVDGELRTVKVESCDSSVAALMIETGYGGMFITALLLLAPVLISLRCWLSSDRSGGMLPLLLLCNMCSYYFLMTNVAIYGWGQQSYMLWIILAMAVVYPLVRRVQTAESSVLNSAQRNTMTGSRIASWGTSGSTWPTG